MAQAQFPDTPILAMDPIEEYVAQESLSKPLFSLYLDLLSLDSPRMDRLWEGWRADLPDLDKENWEDCFLDSTRLMISSRDRLIQTKFLHSVYGTPQRLQRIFPQISLDGPCCLTGTGTYLHMFWSCLGVAWSWMKVFELINFRLQLTFPISPTLPLLGIR